MQVFSVRVCAIFLRIHILQQKNLILGNAEPAADDDVRLKIFAVLFPSFFLESLRVLFLSFVLFPFKFYYYYYYSSG